ncbi:helix-turn-helix domain-containing protein [Amycolatopsis sp. NPDC059027]|uniref:PucR family transcriptional regulator n=1 Tax=unclassified Amycolatopsis TaxID=2618356 RepID=UPI00366D75AE
MRSTGANGLWASLPRELGEKFRPRVDPMARAILQEVQRAVPEYAQPLEGAFGQIITQGIRQAILHCLDSIGVGTVALDTWTTVFRNLGKVEFNEGRSLDCLQTAYRVGGRVAWRHVSEFGQAIGSDADTLCTAAEAIFAYVDEISALSIEGYTAAQARAAGTRARRRRRLLELLLADPPSSPQSIAAQAANAQWATPAEVTVVALERRQGPHGPAAPDLHDDVLVDLEGAEPCLVTGDPGEHLKDLAERLPGWRAVIGPAVRLTDAPRSLLWARRTLRLVQRGVLPDVPITRCSDHLSTLWLLADEFLVRELCARSLAPFDDLTPKQRARLGETLLIWLQSRGSAPEIAKKLKVHPQTVRYRMHQLIDLFGDRLNNADDRLDMEIALRAEALLATD